MPNLYGIGEWYGQLYRTLDRDEREENLAGGARGCPYRQSMALLVPGMKARCNKKGGVCSIRNFEPHPIHHHRAQAFGPLTAACPSRFLEGGTIIGQIGEHVIGTDAPLILKEIPFLKRPPGPVVQADDDGPELEEGEAAADGDQDRKVGRIDMVLVDPDNPSSWCAVEMQAVYFSGASMQRDFDVIRGYQRRGTPMPGGIRRPDFRSCGPKRLMPQVQTKAPTLSRWGKKTVIVIDRSFFDSLAPMDEVDHISNSDIVWAIAGYEEDVAAQAANISIEEFRYTTLADAVKGLTAGVPVSLPEFQDYITDKISVLERARNRAARRRRA